MVDSPFRPRSPVAPYGLLAALLAGACQVEETQSDGGVAGASAAGQGGTANAAGTAGGGSVSTAGAGGTLPLGTGGTTATGGTSTGSAGTAGGPPRPPYPGFGELPVGGAPPATTCESAELPLFCDELLWHHLPARRVLYSWTTPEQVAELRRDRVLFTRTERPDLGRGQAFEAFDRMAALGDAPQNRLLQKLSGELFVKARYAWPNAWGARMGWPGEDYGDQLIRIVLKPEAWIVLVDERSGMAVLDLENRRVDPETAVLTPERVGAIFFVRTEVTGNGSFLECSGGYREFIIGNEAMVEEWSLATAEIRAEIVRSAERFEAFLQRTRAAPLNFNPTTFPLDVACRWHLAANTELSAYLRSLAIASELYMPLPERLAAVASTLRAGLFEPDPFVVRPGE